MDNDQVIAVIVAAEKDLEKLEEKILEMDLTKEKADYQRRIEEQKTIWTEAETTETNTEVWETESESMTAKEVESEQTPHIAGTGSLSLNRSASGEHEDESSDDTDTLDSSSQGEVAVTLSWDEAEVGDDMLYACLNVTSAQEITSGKITITYDKQIMTVDEVDDGEIVNHEGVKLKIKSADEGKIEVLFTSDEGIKLDESIAEPYFTLKAPAKNSDKYEVTVDVDEMKNGTVDLQTKVSSNPLTVGAVDEAETESETETKTKTTKAAASGNGSNSQTTNKAGMKKSAPKTGDTTVIVPFIILAVAAAGVIVLVCWQKRKKER